MTLRQARILSSETDNTIKQEQNTNVNIKISKPQQRYNPSNSSSPPLKEKVNFTLPEEQQLNQALHSQTVNQDYQSQSALPTNSLCQERGITDLGIELDSLEKKNSFLEMLVEMYENNPLKVNSYVVCESKLLMNMIKLLTECDKVELVLSDEVGCSGCTGKDKLIHLTKILITKDGKTEDMKYAYNDIYSEFTKYGISLKIVV